MPFNVNDFRSQLSRDGARPNLFEVEMTLPSFAQNGNAEAKFRFMCKAAQIPGASIGAVPVNYFGREVKVAGNRQFPDWTVTVINDEDYVVRNALERWVSGMNGNISNLRAAGAINSYQYGRDANVVHYAKDGKRIGNAVYKVVGAFPIDVSPIDLDWGQNDVIEEFSVTFAFQYWLNTSTIA